jgi:hypothetical protein
MRSTKKHGRPYYGYKDPFSRNAKGNAVAATMRVLISD